jgi:RND family efflux transporter MFP subunit
VTFPHIIKVYLVPAVVLGVGALLTGGLIALSDAAETGTPPETVVQVEALAIGDGGGPSRLVATGAVSAGQEVVLSPEVAGQVVEVSPRLMPGGRFARGETLLRIDARNYTAALAAAEATLRQRELELALEEGRGEVATREWEMLGEAERQGRDPELALRRPHLVAARQALVAAQAGVERARADVGRTRITAPFNGVVVQEAADVGQVVGAGSQLATLVGTDRARVLIGVPIEQLAVVEVPGLPGPDGSPATAGSAATVTQTLPTGAQVVRRGAVAGLSGQLDPQTREARVLIEVPDPLGEGLPLLPGAFVTVELEGRPLPGAVRVPRVAVKDGDTVWVVGDEDRLVRRAVTVGWSLPDELVITSGLRPGDRVVVTPLSNPLEGQKVALTGARG